MKPSKPFQEGEATSDPTSEEATPVTLRVAKFFGEMFIPKEGDKVAQRKRGRTEPKHYGEALTEEEIMERIREEEEIRKAKVGKQKTKGSCKGKGRGKAKKKATEDENVCQGCNGNYDSDDEEAQESWIGCDEKGCWRWYHYRCGGELDMPDPKLKWTCPACKS